MPLTPEEIYENVEQEGERRLSRPFVELVSTAFVAGADIVIGVIALAVTHHLVAADAGESLGELAGALAFGSAFVLVVLGRSELFTENFLVPLAGVRKGGRWGKLAELWAVSPICNLAGGLVVIFIVTSHGVLPEGTGDVLVKLTETIDDRSVLAAFLSAVAAGALITLMTWIVEGVEALGVKVFTAWLVGFLLALGVFNHVIVVTLELAMGIRYGAGVGVEDVVSNFFVAAAGNMIGGIGLVTLSRFSQATGAQRRADGTS
jgi:formate/nitrite transporter FocA (FNT family)